MDCSFEMQGCMPSVQCCVVHVIVVPGEFKNTSLPRRETNFYVAINSVTIYLIFKSTLQQQNSTHILQARENLYQEYYVANNLF